MEKLPHFHTGNFLHLLNRPTSWVRMKNRLQESFFYVYEESLD